MTATARRTGMTEEAADASVDQACRLLRLPTIRAQFSDVADAAAREQMSNLGFLAELLIAERDDRARRRSERRILPREITTKLRLRGQSQRRPRARRRPRRVPRRHRGAVDLVPRALGARASLHHRGRQRAARDLVGQAEGGRDQCRGFGRGAHRPTRVRGSGHGRGQDHPRPRGRARPRAGEILVAPLTDPGWTPIFTSAVAVVVSVGPSMSHAAIVSRALGIPCVLGVADATRRIADGTLLTVDGGAGTITVH